MAIIKMNLPKCDVCGEVTLPGPRTAYKGVLARDDIRSYDAARRKDDLSPYRCGKCKSPGWDREFSGNRKRKNLNSAHNTRDEEPSLAVTKPIQNGSGLKALYGILEEEFKALGGGEAFLKAERAAWGPDPWEKIAMEDKLRCENAK